MTDSSAEKKKKAGSSKKSPSKRKRSSEKARHASETEVERPQPSEEPAPQPPVEEVPAPETIAEPVVVTPQPKAGFFSKFSGMFSKKKQETEVVEEVPADQVVLDDSVVVVETTEPEAVQEAPVAEAPAPEVPDVPEISAPEVPAPLEGGDGSPEPARQPPPEVITPPPPPAFEAPGNGQVKSESPSTGENVQVESSQKRQSVVFSQVQTEQQQTPTMPVPSTARPATTSSAPPAASAAPELVMRYQIYPDNPEVYVGIQKDPDTGGFRYIVVEPRLTKGERELYTRLTRLLVDELEVDMEKLKNSKTATPYLVAEAKKLATKYQIKISPDSYKKIAYYFNRDFIKLGRIEVLMNDPRIEDISCDGPNIPLFIWHRDYESIPTNVMFKTDEELNTFASKLAYVSGKHISIASPIVDATLPDGSRIQITYGKEVTKKGGTFTIRKFKGDPITVVDMLKYNTCSPELGAYLWYLIERRMSLLVAGGTASGKTTTLNALSMFIPPDQKIVSVEDTPELNLSHKNWIQSVSRGGGVAGEITLFDLLKAALRQRPDIIIVGEVRGVEAFTLFQAIATGHGGLGTIHADSVEAAINRITSEPMNVPKSLLGSTLDCLVMQLRIKLKDRSVRRMVHVAEIVGHEASTDQIVLNNAFKWDPVSDQYIFSGRSRLFEKITKRFGTSQEKIRQDLEDRKIFLKWLMTKNIRDYKDVSQQIRLFYSDKEEVIERALRELDQTT